MIGEYWAQARDGDRRALGLFQRHYSFRQYHTGWHPRRTFIGPGEKMVLLTPGCDALFVWQYSTIYRSDPQQGVRCSVFRNEGRVLSYLLILEACEWAWSKWPGQRLFTYVNPGKIRSVNPGYCFLKAGWERCGINKSGELVVFERTLIPMPAIPVVSP